MRWVTVESDGTQKSQRAKVLRTQPCHDGASRYSIYMPITGTKLYHYVYEFVDKNRKFGLSIPLYIPLGHGDASQTLFGLIGVLDTAFQTDND